MSVSVSTHVHGEKSQWQWLGFYEMMDTRLFLNPFLRL